ncbi:hypothetical protein B0H13DRAFT_2329714 [Mycena leptocephala]|nr:hypothetical protein B0H13DRAFT_2329714 [Mycena leptocephala]
MPKRRIQSQSLTVIWITTGLNPACLLHPSAFSLRPHLSCNPGIQPASASGVRACSLLSNGSIPRARPPRYTEIQITDVYPRFHRHTHCCTPVSAHTAPSLQPPLPRHPAQNPPR